MARARWWTPIGAVAVALGCASGVCHDEASSRNAVADKFANCQAADPTFFGGFLPCFDEGVCNADLVDCTPADQKLLEATVACQNAYAGNSDCSFAGLTAYNSCATKATTLADGGSALSAACFSQFASHPVNCTGD